MNDGYEIDAGVRRKARRLRWIGWLIAIGAVLLIQYGRVFGF